MTNEKCSEAIILALLRQPNLTDAEIAAYNGLNLHLVKKCLPDLERKNKVAHVRTDNLKYLIRECKIKRKPEAVWAVI